MSSPDQKIFVDTQGNYYSSITGPRSFSDSYLPQPSQATLDILGANSIPVEIASFNDAMQTVTAAGIKITPEDQITQVTPAAEVTPVEVVAPAEPAERAEPTDPSIPVSPLN